MISAAVASYIGWDVYTRRTPKPLPHKTLDTVKASPCSAAPKQQMSFKDQLALQNEWKTNRYHMQSDINEACDRMCEESDEPCEIHRMYQEAHKNYPSFWTNHMESLDNI